MRVVNLPRADITPIAYVDINGAQIPAFADKEWARAFFSLTERTGGVTATITTQETEVILEQISLEIGALANRVTQLESLATEIRMQIEALPNFTDLRNRIEAVEAHIEGFRFAPDLTMRVQTIEDRLQ